MKKTLPSIFFLIFILIIALSCLPIEEIGNPSAKDLKPPVLQKLKTQDSKTICLQFDETVFLADPQLTFNPALDLEAVEEKEQNLILRLKTDMQIGHEYFINFWVKDQHGNTNTILARFYGHNPYLPLLVINEFTTQGSSTHPDLIEIKILKSGNMGGLTFFHGTKSSFAYKFIFPPFFVQAGDFILLHVKPQNIPAEINETTDKTISGGLNASPTAFDLWVKEGTGLSGNNGIIAIYDQPDGEIIDAVIYSNRTSDSDVNYRGFGSRRFMEQADELVASLGWQAGSSLIRPEDAVNPEDSTATRSICRSSTSIDTNTKTDFHIVPTKKSSFGTDNSDEIYTPKK